ncbi:hypothetical protein LSH36_459g00034 [Paralvinella palmiformis]|uniref:rhomboid protease n=1 Tax=Paralvinella palmiformis TaxID=53620 RepID=A0AAD9MYU5_9ANNE|nr:hypothetical protein LSH36_459g00034 [Paralvinella palmiformis]
MARMSRRWRREHLLEEGERHFHADNYSCFPPPIFVPTITLVEICSFIYYSLDPEDRGVTVPLPARSVFIYRPDRRLEVWRFIFYMLVHAGWVHLFFNMLVQLTVGVPLEMVHGSFRVGLIYMAGVLAGSLGMSVFDMSGYLVGASGGVYALLAAHLANILLNYTEMELAVYKLVAVLIVAGADVGLAIWDRYTNDDDDDDKHTTGYVAHLMGALAGFTIGLLVLKHFEHKLKTQIIWWLALTIYSACTLFAVFWNVYH